MHSNNNELVKAGHDLAKALSADAPLTEIAKMITSLATQLDVTTAALRAMQSERDQLAAQLADVVAENVSLREYRPQPSGAAMMEALDSFYEYHEDVPEQGMMAAFEILCCKRPQTPATDRFLAEQRAVGVAMFAEKCSQKSKQAISCDTRDSWWLCGEHASDYAAQRRNEVKG